jgi:hypothetical protein
MKLCKVGGVQGLVPEDPVNGEILLWLEGVGLGEPVQHAGAHCCRVSPNYPDQFNLY